MVQQPTCEMDVYAKTWCYTHHLWHTETWPGVIRANRYYATLERVRIGRASRRGRLKVIA